MILLLLLLYHHHCCSFAMEVTLMQRAIHFTRVTRRTSVPNVILAERPTVPFALHLCSFDPIGDHATTRTTPVIHSWTMGDTWMRRDTLYQTHPMRTSRSEWKAPSFPPFVSCTESLTWTCCRVTTPCRWMSSTTPSPLMDERGLWFPQRAEWVRTV